MELMKVLEALSYALILFYGLFLSVEIAGGGKDAREKRLIVSLYPVLLLIQGLGWLLLGTEAVRQAYPLLTHLPLALILIFALKKRAGVALVSVFTAYLLCQLPRWVKLMIVWTTKSPLLGELAYILCIAPLFVLLWRYFAPAACRAMTYSNRSLLLFGSLPAVYYLFDYATTVYANALLMNSAILMEFLPTALILFYVLFLTAYHAQMQRWARVELQSSLFEAELKQARTEMDGLRGLQMQTAVYRHDMRHHLTVIGGFIAADDKEKALDYIRNVEENVAAIAPRRYSGNETVDLLCSAFADRAKRLGVQLTVKAELPDVLSVPDTELSAVIANGLENALKAAGELDGPQRWVKLYCSVKRGKLLVEISNPYAGKIVMRGGVPVSEQAGHGYGCQSIQTIVQRLGGICLFEAEQGVFTFRAALPERSEMPVD